MKALVFLLLPCLIAACDNSTEFTCGPDRCIPQRWVCDGDQDCFDGSDEVNCNGTTSTTVATPTPSAKTQSPSIRLSRRKCPEFQCQITGGCIPNRWVCDGEKDCPDSSDENNCNGSSTIRGVGTPTPTPSVGTQPPSIRLLDRQCPEFQCQVTGDCIPNRWLCNGEKDCLDGSDEKNCSDTTTDVPFIDTTPQPPSPSSCPGDQFQCQSNDQCIPGRWHCDHAVDCPDGSDETNCDESPIRLVTTIGGDDRTAQSPATTGRPSCTREQFVCDNGKNCISPALLCDQVQDCADGSDEGPMCPSAQTTTPGPQIPDEEFVPVPLEILLSMKFRRVPETRRPVSDAERSATIDKVMKRVLTKLWEKQ